MRLYAFYDYTSDCYYIVCFDGRRGHFLRRKHRWGYNVSLPRFRSLPIIRGTLERRPNLDYVFAVLGSTARERQLNETGYKVRVREDISYASEPTA